ncbi:MAG: type IV toxin-antitoxin system AbiEi family antitoxin [Sporichthyaceae bacterium]
MTKPRGSMHRAFTRAYAVEQGYSPAQIRSNLRRGVWVRLRPGVYASAEDAAAVAVDPVQGHALECAAVLLALTPRYFAAASSAARLYGLDWLEKPALEVVLLTADPLVHGINRDGYLLRQAPLPDGHTTRRHGIPLTSPARTLLDLASELPFMDSVVLVDSALRRGLVTMEELETVLEGAAGRPGIEQARLALRFGDPASESALESASRVVFHQYGIPAPETQVRLRLTSGRNIRPDFRWPVGLLGEADGKAKYEPSETRSTLEVVLDEKARENEMRDDGLEFVRWGWREVKQPELLVRRVRAGLERATQLHSGRAG